MDPADDMIFNRTETARDLLMHRLPEAKVANSFFAPSKQLSSAFSLFLILPSIFAFSIHQHILLSMHSVVHSLIHSFIRSFVHPFIHLPCIIYRFTHPHPSTYQYHHFTLPNMRPCLPTVILSSGFPDRSDSFTRRRIQRFLLKQRPSTDPLVGEENGAIEVVGVGLDRHRCHSLYPPALSLPSSLGRSMSDPPPFHIRFHAFHHPFIHISTD